jgi:NADH-quinone oxidoreductase subunit A
MESPTTLWSLVAYFAVVVVLAAGMLVVSWLLGERHRDAATNTPYESGMLPTGSARIKYPADFYLIAMFFVIFDLESVFIIAWAIAMRKLGWAGYAEMVLFTGVLLAGLAYLWRVGALDWGPERLRQRRCQ